MAEKYLIMVDAYWIMLEAHQKDMITSEEWHLFCESMLNDLMVANKDVLKRLKE